MFVTSLRSVRILVVTLAVFSAVFFTTSITVAQASICDCTITNEPGKIPCPQLPCTENNCTGMCVIPGKCNVNTAVCADGSKGNPQGAEQAAKAAMDMAKSLMDAMKGGGGGGGSGGGGSPQPTQPTQQPTLGDNLLDSLTGLTNGSTTVGSALTDISDALKDLFTDATTTVTIVPGKDSNSPTNSQSTATGTLSATTTKTLPPVQPKSGGSFGQSADGTSFSGSYIDYVTNTGLGGFMSTARGMVNRICSAQPWQTSFVSQIFSPTFFDGMCESFGAAAPVKSSEPVAVIAEKASLLCPAAARPGEKIELSWKCPQNSASSGSGFNTLGAATGTTEVVMSSSTMTFKVMCGRGGGSECKVNTIAPKVQITATPARVQLSTRSRIYWAASDVLTCDVTGPNFHETGLRGAATTGTILDTSTFTIVCKTASGSTVSAKTTIDVGI